LDGCFSVFGRDLYIYFTEGKMIMDTGIFPDELYHPDRDWMVSKSIILCPELEEDILETIIGLLKTLGYNEIEGDRDALDEIFKRGG
jgi:hypothetical protein